MVKGITKQVIVVHSPEPKLFEQAIFILNEDAMHEGVTDEMLLREAKKAVRQSREKTWPVSRALWGLLGAGVTGTLWLLSCLF
ncbi:MAG: hypothetical protein E7462_05820 [Ruminococcaceae bacterium]|nr:hypothetical protein [Oscillospiraceae bacterium]